MKTDKLNGKWTKLLKAFAILYGLEHVVEVYGDGDARVGVIIKNAWFENVIDVFEDGKAACLSSLSKFIFWWRKAFRRCGRINKQRDS